SIRRIGAGKRRGSVDGSRCGIPAALTSEEFVQLLQRVVRNHLVVQDGGVKISLCFWQHRLDMSWRGRRGVRTLHEDGQRCEQQCSAANNGQSDAPVWPRPAKCCEQVWPGGGHRW